MDNLYILSAVPNFSANVGKDVAADVKIQVGEDESYIDVFEETLYGGDDGSISVRDMQSLLEPYFGDNQTIVVKCSVEKDGDDEPTETIFYVQYGNVEVNDFEYFVKNHFLTNYDTKRTCMERVERLTMADINTTNIESVIVKAYYLSEKNAKVFTLPVEENFDQTYGDYWVYDINTSPNQFLSDNGESPYRYVVICDKRSLEYIVESKVDDSYQVFLFKNCFNVWDAFYCMGRTETEIQFERSGAMVNGKYLTYKSKEVRLLNCDTGVLLKEEKEWVLDLLRSRHIYLCKNDAGSYDTWKEVSIVESEAKSTNEDDNMPRFTFSCRYNQRQHNIIDESDDFPQIFSDKFTSVYG